MDESSAFLIVSLAFFLTICVFAFILEISRSNRAESIEMQRHDRRVAEQREFGYDPVQQTIINQQSFRRFIK